MVGGFQCSFISLCPFVGEGICSFVFLFQISNCTNVYLCSYLHAFRMYGLPQDENVVVFCNFNKIDKLDPVTFGVWMGVSHM